MKAINADPKEIREIFTKKYIIPDYQRPYAWGIEECDKLWEDLLTFFSNKKSEEDKYFLGNIVIYPQKDAFVVIDGQQRLTTILLLIKAFHQKAGTVKALEECLKTKNPLTSELTDELRVNSLVLDKDKEYLRDIIFNDGNNTPECKLKNNYNHLANKIEEWWRSVNQSTDQLNDLILTLLDQVVLLPIHCDSEDDALTIFETINNRGISLTDADIFKAKLYHAASEKNKADTFIKKWNSLDYHEWLFRVYMHILRAKEGVTDKESALRTYFSENKNGRLRNWESVMNSIALIYEIEQNWEAPDEIEILWNILLTYPNYYWNFPLFVYLHKYGSLNKNDFMLSTEYNKDFLTLVEETCKYFFIKGVVHNSVNAVKDTVFKVCALIEKEGDYISEYKKNSINDFNEFQRRIENRQYGRYLKGLVLLVSYLNPQQDKSKLKWVIKNKYHIEHILPKKWNNYDEWTQETWEQNLDALGNLVPLEWNLNISAQNEFFAKKKDRYKESLVQDALDLVQLNDWHPTEFNNRHKECEERILNFFIHTSG
jgi:uncharacterized protein with ParB-like and HNH nuclease domain